MEGISTGHNLQALGTASLDTFGGLVTAARPEDLPEGASPRTWDTDFIIGSVFTRPGLSSVFTFTQTLTITSVIIVSGNIATFTYVGITPTVNEGFLLSGFTGAASFLNGQTVFVVSVNPINFTFQTVVAGSGTFSGQNGTAASTTGNFVGPNLGGSAVVTGSSGNVWSNPTGILGVTLYASVATGTSTSTTIVPTLASNSGTVNPWVSPSNIFATGASVASVSLAAPSTSAPILANGLNLGLPVDATVVGISTSFSASCNAPAGKASIQVQLATNGFPIGTPVNVPISSVTSSYVQGSSAYKWGTVLTPAVLNGSSFGILLEAILAAGGGSATFQANTLSLKVYYTTASTSAALQVKTFSFTIPATSGVSGFGVTFQAYSTSATTLTFQLLKNGLPVGSTHTQVLTTVPTIYSLGASNDLWGSTWLYSDVNSTQYGVQITAQGLGTSLINDLDILTYLTPGLTNFNYVKSFVQNNNQTNTLALDASGILWEEDVTNNPNVLAIALTGILPGSFAKSATADDQEYLMFSDLSVGTERPRVYNGTQFYPLSQVGPGAPPIFLSSVGTAGATLSITAYSLTSNVVTFTYTGTQPSVGQLYAISGASPSYLNITGTVLSTGLSSTQFQMALVHANDPGGAITATATLTYSYPITSIVQRPANPKGPWQDLLWSSGPGSTSPGTVLTIYYAAPGPNVDATLVNDFNAGIPVYVYITGTPAGFGFQGTYLVTSASLGTPPGAGAQRWYITVNVGTSGYAHSGANPTGSYQQTLATLTVSSPIPNIVQGDTINISLSSPSAWNASWPVAGTLKSGVFNITNTAMDNTGIATYQFNVQSGVAPVPGNIVNITGCTNNAIFNTTGTIATVVGGAFTISGFPGGAPITSAVEAGALGVTFGSQFTIDPGLKTLGTGTSPIYGNSTSGQVTTVGGSVTPIGAGTRQGVVFFITASGYETAMSPPVVFTTSSQANFINASNIPIGPPNVIARGIAFTEAGQNGVPGANFYVIENPVTITVNNVTTTYSSTIIRDNVSTNAKFTFTDAVLLNATEVDVQGNDLFNLIELGSSGWCVPYASRMFYGLQLNKVDNFNNLTFDGGYLPNPGGSILPLGWNISAPIGGVTVTLQTSSVTGMSLYINNASGGTVLSAGLMSQTAYQDAYQVPIIHPNTLYSVRVAARCPSGVQLGNLVLSLVDFNGQIGYGNTYGSFTAPLKSMTSNIAVFSGSLLTSPFVGTVSKQLTFALQITNMGNGADCEIDRIEVFPTIEPYLLAQVYGSYVNNLEAVDASGSGGIIDTTTENPQPCMGGFVMHDDLYLLKTNSMYSTQDTPTSEPGGWGLHEVSNKVGTVGIHSYDTGEEWMTTACRAGIYGFNGGQPVKLMQELWNLWETINWNAGKTIVLRNDIVNRRLLCAVPLPTPNTWLPSDPVNVAPTSPNVILMLNYQGLNTFEELVSSPEVHATMFGVLAAVDLKRKWSIWRIPTPYMDFITRPDGTSHPLFVCNGKASSKIYQFLDKQLSDDGVAINGLYTTYGHVNAAKAATLPIFGFHTKRYTVLQFTGHGAGALQIRILPNVINPKYAYTLPIVNLVDPANDDWFRPINAKAQRAYLEFSTNAVGSWMQIDKSLLTGRADPWSSLNPTGGGNNGIA